MPADKIRVLIVDDIAETRENIRKLLQFESDVEVVGAARSGKEGIQLAQELDPDVVLMDINMPDIDGIAATGRSATGQLISRWSSLGARRSDYMPAPCWRSA
jgi:pilus assembly protein CpaE